MKMLESEKRRFPGDWPAFLGESAGITWIDLYLAPILSDLKAIPEWYLLTANTPCLVSWFEAFSLQPCFQNTSEGSLAHQRQC